VPMSTRSSPWLASLRLGILVILGVSAHVWFLPNWLIRSQAGRDRYAAKWLHRWFWWTQKLYGIDIQLEGKFPEPPFLLVSNHVGYIDVIVIATLLPTLFVANAELTRLHPVIRYYLWLSKSILAARKSSRSDEQGSLKVAKELKKRFKSGCAVWSAPEAGGSPHYVAELGGYVVKRRFFHTLLYKALEAKVPIVPLGLQYRVINSGINISDDVAYFRPGKNLGRHFLHLMGLRGISVKAVVGQPIQAEEPEDPDDSVDQLEVAGLVETVKPQIMLLMEAVAEVD
jgi:1-acyl-sn-glycerol-3-phosphate acyltransferase